MNIKLFNKKSSPTGSMKVVYTAQSKMYFFCRDAVCEFVFRQNAVPLNPFRVFDYFLGDRVDRDLVRQANNQLVRTADEIWVFGPVADGVLFEIALASGLGKTIRFFSIGSKVDEIKAISPAEVVFEEELRKEGIGAEELTAILSGKHQSSKPRGGFINIAPGCGPSARGERFAAQTQK